MAQVEGLNSTCSAIFFRFVLVLWQTLVKIFFNEWSPSTNFLLCSFSSVKEAYASWTMHCATLACLFFSLQHMVAAYTISSALHFMTNTFVGVGLGANLSLRTPSPQPEFLDCHSCKSLSGDIKEITKRPLRNESSEPCEYHQISLFVQHP